MTTTDPHTPTSALVAAGPATRAGRGWAYIGAVLGAAVSVAANVAHSFVPPSGTLATWTPQPGAVIGSVFWPIAVLVSLEILARVPWPTARRWHVVRWGGLTPVGIVAAVVSYRHLSGLLGYYGEDSVTCLIGPVAVDGLMLLASGALLASTTHTQPARAHRPTVETPDTATPDVEAPPVDVPDVEAPDVEAPDVEVKPKTATRRPGDTAVAVTRIRKRNPNLTPAEIASRLGVTERTVRRHLNAPASGPAPRPVPDLTDVTDLPDVDDASAAA